MKAISNYIAAIITVSMIFTSIFFLVNTMIRQSRLSGYALNNMSLMIDKARESINVDYIVRKNNDSWILTLYIYNRGEVDILVNNIILVLRNLTVYKYNVSYTVPLGSISRINLTLKYDLSEILSIKITTLRGNVFDILIKTQAPIDKLILVNATKIITGSAFEITLVISNRMNKGVIVNPARINLSFVNYISKEYIGDYFEQIYRFPEDAIILNPGSQVNIRYVYRYRGGLSIPTIVDLTIYLDLETVEYEYLESSGYITYLFVITG
ncbi:MAG: hypothetical protein QXO78_01050 [Desulfurococcaceae archaeon]